MELDLRNGRVLSLDRPAIMGILNVTPDSFSDGGRWLSIEAAVSHGLSMVIDGADVIDVGGESTRPGSERVDAQEQIRRTKAVIRRLSEAIESGGREVAISIDTTLAPVAEAALSAGATIVNDVSAGEEDPGMWSLVRERACPYVMMHKQGSPATMQESPTYSDVVAEVHGYLKQRAEMLASQGMPGSQIVLDPGIGFGKSRDHNLALVGHLRELVGLGYAVLLGTSRKRFMGSICRRVDGAPPTPETLVGATCATTSWGVQAGVHLFRVHDVLANRQAADVTAAVLAASGDGHSG